MAWIWAGLMLALIPWALAIFEKGYLIGLDARAQRRKPQAANVGALVLFLNGTTLIADLQTAALFGKRINGGQSVLRIVTGG